VKLGAENRNKVIAASALGVLAIVLLGRILFTPESSAPSAAAPTASAVATTASPAARVKTRGKRAGAPPRSLDPSLRYDWLKASEDTKYEGNGRNIFLAQAEIPQPVAKAQTEEAEEAAKGPPPPPPPPPINLKFFGFASKPGEPKKIFLSQGEDVFIASEGEVVDRHYKVLRITPMSVEIEDVLNNNRQNIPLTQG
jgi:hypothetical protein